MKAFGKFKLGNGLKFDGIDDYAANTAVVNPYTFLETGVYTFEYIAYMVNSVPNSDVLLFMFENSISPAINIQDRNDMFNWRWQRPYGYGLYTGFNTGRPFFSKYNLYNRINKIHAIWKGTSPILYVNGKQYNVTFETKTQPLSVDFITNQIGISSGDPASTNSNSFINALGSFSSNTVYFVRMYNRELSQLEILELNKNPSWINGNIDVNDIILNYDFNQNRGNILTDLSGNGFHLTINGMGTATDYGGYDGNSGWINAISGKRAL